MNYIFYGASLDSIGNTAGSVGSAFSGGIDSLISGKTPALAKPRFSGRDIATKTFTRNEGFWGIGLNGLSAISPNNSRSSNSRAGTAITKRHIICAAHYPLSVGDTVDLVADVSGATTAVTRTIVQAKTHSLYSGQSGGYSYDIQICLLDSDLPSSVDIMEILPSDAGNYAGEYSWIGTRGCAFDKEQKGISTIYSILLDAIYFGQKLEDHYFIRSQPDSMLWGLRYDPVNLGFSSTSDNFSFETVSASDDVYTFAENVIVGDSGSPCCFILGSKLILIGLHTGFDFGTYLPNRIADINQLILDVDTLQNDLTGYTVTEADLSAYPTYP